MFFAKYHATGVFIGKHFQLFPSLIPVLSTGLVPSLIISDINQSK